MHGTGNYVSLSGAPETCMTGRYVCVSLMCVHARVSQSEKDEAQVYTYSDISGGFIFELRRNLLTWTAPVHYWGFTDTSEAQFKKLRSDSCSLLVCWLTNLHRS